MLRHDCGTAWSGMLIYFLIFPGLNIVIAGNTPRLARSHKKLQTVVLAVAPRVKEVTGDNPKKGNRITGRVLVFARRGADFSACD